MGKPIERQDITIQALMTEYLKDAAPTLRPKTIHSYTQLSRLHIVPHLGHIKVSKLDARTVGQWQRMLLESGLSGQTVNLARACLSRALDMAMRFDYIGRNVVILAKAPTVVHRQMAPLGRADAQAILALFDGTRFETVVSLIIGCGLRIGEVLGLTWGDIDAQNQRLTVAHQLGRTKGNTGAFILSSPKTQKGFRAVALPEFVLEALQHQKIAQLEALRFCTEAGAVWGNEWGLVFTTGTGHPLAYRNVMRTIQDTVQRSDLEMHITPHVLRHLHASLLVAQGINMKVVSTSLGHSQINLTMDRYAHLVPDIESGAAGAMQSAMKSPLADAVKKPVAVKLQSKANERG